MSPQYHFSARNFHGETINSTLTANNRHHALDLLHTRSLVPVHLKEIHDYRLQIKRAILIILERLGCRPYSNRDMMIFCRQFATMIKAGIPILQCLKFLSHQVEISALNKQIRVAALEVEYGSSLSAAMHNCKDSFPPIMVSMIEVGETGGALDTVMERMAEHFEKQHDLQEKIRSATLYPIFIIGIAIVVMAVMVIYVLPQFAQIFNSIGMAMPFYTRLLLGFGNLIRDHWLILLLSLCLIAIGLFWYSQTKKGRQIFDLIRLCFPLFGKIYRQTLSAHFSRTLGTLLAGGVTLHKALELVDKIMGNVIISESITKINTAVSSGETIADPLREIKYFPPLLSEMIRIGEETGALEKTLHSTAVFYEREVSYHVERLSTILEPLLLLIVGLFIGLLVFSILSPMYRVFEMI